MVFLASCTGNGGSAHSGGATYEAGGSGSSSGASGGPNGNTLSATDITSLANAGDTGKLITLLTAGQDSGKTTPVDISVADMGLPAGTTGSVTITMTVNGTTRTYRADIAGDTVHFDIPAVPSNSEVSVRMDVRDSGGTLMLTGKTSKTVSGTDDALAVTLSDKIDVPVTLPPDCDALFFVYYMQFPSGFGGPPKTECSASSSGSFSESLGTIIDSIIGYAVKSDFSVVAFEPVNNVTVTEDFSVAFTPRVSPVSLSNLDGYIKFHIYTDERYELYSEGPIGTTDMFSGAYEAGLFSLVDAHIQLTSNAADPNAWYDLSPTGTLGPTNNCRLRYKLKAGGITSGEFFSPSVMAQMHA